MTIPNPFLLNLECRDQLSDSEKSIVKQLSERRQRFAAKSDIVSAGESPRNSCLMLSGLSARYNLLDDGRRQITAVHVPGDFVDLHSLLLTVMDHSVLALSDCEIAMVPHDFLRELSVAEPHFTRLLWLLTVIDAAIYRRWLVASGRLSSVGQIAHFLCEIFVRLDTVLLAENFTFRLPMSQLDLSDAMGLSVVHANRTLQHLRRDGLIQWQGDTVRILDWPGLQDVAEFDPTYLNLKSTPR
jgi:CRP-like cAMP-binding protein